MSSHAPTIPNARAAIPGDYIWRLSVSKYHEMMRAGILTDEDPIELLEGWLVTKMPKNPPHQIATGLVHDALQAIVPAGSCVNIQGSITLSDSEPEPDAVIVRGNRRDRHPGPKDIALVVEVSDSTLERDRTLKKKVYAAAELPIYWILNLIDRRLEVFQDPAGADGLADYRTTRVYGAADSVAVYFGTQQIGIIPISNLLP